MATKKKKTAKKVLNKKVNKKTPTTKVKKVTAPTVQSVSIDDKNKINTFVQKNFKFVNSIMLARKGDIHNVFEIKRAIAEIKNNPKLNQTQKQELLTKKKEEMKVAKVKTKENQAIIDDTVNKAIEANFYDLKVCFSYQQIKYSTYLDKLNKIRRDGENKVIALRSEIQDIILNKQIDKNTKKQLIKNNRIALKKAKEIAKINRKEVNLILKEAMRYSKLDFKSYFKLVKKNNEYDNKISRHTYHQMVDNLNKAHKEKVKEIKNKGIDNKKATSVDLKAENIAFASKINETKTARNEALNHSKENRYNAFMNKYNYTGKLKNDKHPLGEWLRFKYEHYIANFNLANWLLKNALFVVIIIVFATLIGITGGGLLEGKNILGALVQISPKIFFALGVAGLILLGGTDLSIGRLTGVGVSFSLMIMSSYTYSDQLTGGQWWLFTNAPDAIKIICALLVSIIVCTLFTTFAGFFTAKFKMHPFISTLAVQLISYGFFQMFWSATPSFIADQNILTSLRGPSSVLLVIYAAIAIAIVWFIWNKTKFGKNMYAVGGNQEAATVSGINPFAITMLAFVMAGILYGIGGFVQAVQTGTGNFTFGYGTETDAIAACVIGGISFSGGVGKVGGAVIGAIILGFLTYAFSYINVDSNLQLLIKGVIIIIAVALDCVKYLRKK